MNKENMSTKKLLENAFKTAHTLIKKNKRPWIFLLGAPHSGKTTLITHANIPLLSPTQKSLKKIEPTRLIDWWIADHAVFIDPAGCYALPEPSAAQEQQIWQDILKLSNRYHGHSPVNHVVLIIDIVSLMQSDIHTLEKMMQQFTHQLLSIMDYNRILQSTVIITQCDRLSGFSEYFEDLGLEERVEPFGFTLSVTPENLFTEEKLEKLFQKLIKQIGDRLIWRLHHEQSLTKRRRIINFPMQMELLCKQLQNFLMQLPWSNTIHLNGVFFTSSQQKGETFYALSQFLENAFPLPSITKPVSASLLRSFFIQKTVKKLIYFANLPVMRPVRNTWAQWVAISTAFIVIAILTLLWHRGYLENKQAFKQVEKTLYRTPKPEFNITGLAQLNLLNKTIRSLNQHPALFYRWVGLIQTSQLKYMAEKNYRQLLLSSFEPFLNQVLVKNIRSSMDKPLPLYFALRTYLMLTSSNRFDAQVIQQWFVLYWRNQYYGQPVLQAALTQHLSQLLHIKSLSWQKDKTLIQQAQAKLKQLSPAQIIFLELQSQFKPINIPIIFEQQKLTGINVRNASIPLFYSAQQFDYIYNEKIPTIINAFKKGDWVLNTIQRKILSPQQKKQLITTVRQLYAQSYTQQWLAIIPNITLIQPEHLQNSKTTITLLTDIKSPLYKLLKIAVNNVKLGAQKSSQIIKNTEFNAIQDFIQKKGNYKKIQDALKKLNVYINGIIQTKNVTKASYDSTVNRFQSNDAKDPLTTILKLATTLPQPLQSWLHTIAIGTWKGMLKNSRDYINTVWNASILPKCITNINNRYPIDSNAKQDMLLEEFTQFFGPNGSIQNFFQTILQPFVNITSTYWTWNELDGENISIPQTTLNMFLRASLIQQMFFTDNAKMPGFQFTLVPVHLSPNLSAFVLNLGGQSIQVRPGATTINTLTWPGPNPNQATILFTENDGKTTSISTSGPWAWFKLLEHAKLQPTRNPRQFVLTFESEDYSITFELFANNLVNPYLPNIINQFRCPKNL